MKKENLFDESEEQEYYFSTRDENNELLLYSSEFFKLSERDIINLIKICLINARDKTIGKKILAIYRDSTQHRKHITQEKLKLIGIKEEEQKPTKIGRKTKTK
jgi:hypothetical protein